MSSASAIRTPWLDNAEIRVDLFMTLGAPLALQPDRRDDERGLGQLCDIVRNAVGEHRVADEVNDQPSDQRADNRRPSAAEQSAADRNGGDRVEFGAQADLIGVAR